MSWYLYVLQCSDDTLYAGITTDISRRVKEHNVSSKGAKYTRSRRPVKVIYTVKFVDRSTAQIAEISFKKKTRPQKLDIIKTKNDSEILATKVLR
jgi:putative endonuclease